MEKKTRQQMGYRTRPDLMAAFKLRVAEIQDAIYGPEGDALSESHVIECWMARLVQLPLLEAAREFKEARDTFTEWTRRQEDLRLERLAGGADQGKPAGGSVVDIAGQPKKPQSSPPSSNPVGHGKPRGHR